MSTLHVMVTNGGNKFDLFAQLTFIDRQLPYGGPPFWLELLPPQERSGTEAVTVGCAITGIVAADSSGDSWYINGELQLLDSPEWLVDMFCWGPSAVFHGIYNTRTRQGSLLPGRIHYLQQIARR